MVIFPNCKINLGLNIIRKRDDGFHDLETIFYPLPLCDCLEILEIPGQEPKEGSVQFTTSGLPVPTQEDQNLCTRAYTLLRRDFGKLPPIAMHLHKAIPLGAGLGGGSADGAFTLSLLNEKFRLGLTVEKLSEYALQLGSDAPFFIHNRPCLGRGRGELLEEVNINLKGYKIIIINPGIEVSTSWAFSSIRPSIPVRSIREIVSLPVNEWKNLLANDFELPVFEHHPLIREIKDELYRAGAKYASMSGSGSTVYGLFKETGMVSPFENGKFFVKEFNLP